MTTVDGERLSMPIVVTTTIALLAGLALGLLTQPIAEGVEHRPEENAIVAHLVIGVVLLVGAVLLTLVTRSVSWAWWPLSADMGRRISSTFRHARGSVGGALRCVALVLIATVMLYVVARMGLQATAGRNPGFTVNAWGGPSALGAFAAHGIDAILCIGIGTLIVNLVLHRPDP